MISAPITITLTRNVVLQGYAVSVTDTAFLNIFGGGAECYVPDFFGGETMNMTCVIAGVLIAALYVLITMKNRVSRKKKGGDPETLKHTHQKSYDEHHDDSQDQATQELIMSSILKSGEGA